MHNISYRRALLMVMMLFPITTLVERYVGILNKLLLVIAFGLLLIDTLRRGKLKRKRFLFILFALATFLVSMSITPISALMLNPNMAIYYIFLVLLYWYYSDYKAEISSDLVFLKSYIYMAVLIFTVILVISFVLPWSYIPMTSGGWGDELYFASLSNSPNRVGPACLFIIVLLIFLYRNDVKKHTLPCMILPHLYVAVAGGSRTYLVLILLTIIIFLYYWLNPKKMFWLLIIPFGMLVLYVILHSNMLTKIQISLSYARTGNTYEFWRRLTNSRSVLWPARINAFKEFPLFYKLFGKGVNYTTYTFGMWSHSDFIEIACSFGYIGLVIYIVTILHTIKKLLPKDGSRLVHIIVVIIWLFNAFFNFFYCYFNAVLCYPILLMIVYKKDYIIEMRKKKRGKFRIHKSDSIVTNKGNKKALILNQ